jgi:hypothetical protein
MIRRYLSLALIIVASLFASSAAHAQGAQRIATATGNVNSVIHALSFAQVKVCSYSAPTVACNSTVTIYQNPTLATPYTTNPITADANGNYSYWVTPGNYVEQVCATGATCVTQLITLGGSGSSIPAVVELISGDGNGNALGVPEKGTTVASGVASVAWDEDISNGRFDCRNTAYAGGCLGSTPGLAMQAFANRLICYEAETGKHASTIFPPGAIPVGTAAYPTLSLPAGANYRGSSGYTGSRTTFVASYNNKTALYFTSPLTPTAACADGTTPTDSLVNGSTGGFSERGCNQGGCSNAPGDTGNYPLGGPLQIGMVLNDSNGVEGLDGGLYATNNGADGIICGGLDTHCEKLGGAQNNYYFYYGMDQAGQNYVFNTTECHGEVDILGIDDMGDGPFETYGTSMIPGAEYGKVGGVCWAAGISNLGPTFAQIEEIGIIHFGSGNGLSHSMGTRIDGSRGAGLYEIGGGNTTWVGVTIDGACLQNPAADYLVYNVTTATPGSAQTPGTYLLTANSGQAQISVTVASGGTVTANPIVTSHGRGYSSSTTVTFTLAAGGTPATFTVQMEPYNYIYDGGFGGITPCPGVFEDSAGGNDTFVGGTIETQFSFFGTSYATGDVFAQEPAKWVAVQGSLGSGGILWDSNLSSLVLGNAQSIINNDAAQAAGSVNVTGTTINVGNVGHYFTMANTSATTLTAVTNAVMGSEIEIIGDGYTTMPYETAGQPNPPSGSTTFGAVTCPKTNLLLAANVLYRFKVTGGQVYGEPTVLTESCDAPNDLWRQSNFLSLSGSLPTTYTLAAEDVAGALSVRPLPALANGTISSAGSASSYTYSYLLRVWVAGGTQVNSPTTTAITPVAPTSMNNVNYNFTLPAAWTRYQIIFQATTDSSYTAKLGVVVDVTSSLAYPQPSLAISFAATPSMTSSAAVLSTTWYAANMTGSLNQPGFQIPAHGSYPGVTGQTGDDPVGGYRYICTAPDTWKRTPTTYSTF